MTNTLSYLQQELDALAAKSNLRQLPDTLHRGKDVETGGHVMLNLSSNDYLGLSTYLSLSKTFLENLTVEDFLPTSSSSRLLTGNFEV